MIVTFLTVVAFVTNKYSFAVYEKQFLNSNISVFENTVLIKASVGNYHGKPPIIKALTAVIAHIIYHKTNCRWKNENYRNSIILCAFSDWRYGNYCNCV